MPTTAITIGQKTAPRPSTASSSRIAPNPSAASAIAGPTSPSRRIRPGRRPPRVALSMPGAPVSKWASDGQHPPETGVEGDAEAAEERREHEAGAHPQHREPEVPGQARGHAAEDGLLGVAGGATGPRRDRRGPRIAHVCGGTCAAHRGSIAHTTRRSRTMRANPGPTLTGTGRVPGPGSGASPMVRGPRTAQAGAMTTTPPEATDLRRRTLPAAPLRRWPAGHPRRGPRPRPAAPFAGRPQGGRRRGRSRLVTSTSTRSSCGSPSWCWSSSAAPA